MAPRVPHSPALSQASEFDPVEFMVSYAARPSSPALGLAPSLPATFLDLEDDDEDEQIDTLLLVLLHRRHSCPTKHLIAPFTNFRHSLRAPPSPSCLRCMARTHSLSWPSLPATTCMEMPATFDLDDDDEDEKIHSHWSAPPSPLLPYQTPHCPLHQSPQPPRTSVCLAFVARRVCIRRAGSSNNGSGERTARYLLLSITTCLYLEVTCVNEITTSVRRCDNVQHFKHVIYDTIAFCCTVVLLMPTDPVLYF